jgi:hypothetical protein
MTEMPDGDAAAAKEAVSASFGFENRRALLRRYFDDVAVVSADSSWMHTYALLLWIDSTTGLAHCYESDKCQQGRPWYVRSLAFHAWLSEEMDVDPTELGTRVDQLFKWATEDLAVTIQKQRDRSAALGQVQRLQYSAEMPIPGEDPEISEIITAGLGDYLSSEPSVGVMRDVVQRVRWHVGLENKRKNLLGEGFEDTLYAILTRIPEVAEAYEIHTRVALHELPGFYPPRQGDKTKKVDLALVRKPDQHRILVSCKWSVRSDREEQFSTDAEAYARLERSREPYDYVLVTNEFDPARLRAACENRSGPNLLFSSVVHVNPAGPLAAYDAPATRSTRGAEGIRRTRELIEGRRLIGLREWIGQLGG